MRWMLVLWCHQFISCGGTPWTSTDSTSATHAVQLSQKCSALCKTEAGCSPDLAVGCFEAIDCNVGSMLHRHGASDLDSGLECKP